jgi:hypothetical protein
MGMREEALKELARRELARREQARSGKPEIVEEMHEGISFTDRAIVKNFAQSPEKGASYIKKQNPNLETRVYDGRVLVKDRNATKWNVLDPEGFDLQDITDLGYDAAALVGEGLAAGALGAATGGLGAAGAFGATAAGAEALRQSIGSGLGIDQDVSGSDVALAGTLGAAMPFVPTALKKAALGTKGAIKGTAKFLGGVDDKAIAGMTREGEKAISKLETETVVPTLENLSKKMGRQISEVEATRAQRIYDIKASSNIKDDAQLESVLRAEIEAIKNSPNPDFRKIKNLEEMIDDIPRTREVRAAIDRVGIEDPVVVRQTAFPDTANVDELRKTMPDELRKELGAELDEAGRLYDEAMVGDGVNIRPLIDFYEQSIKKYERIGTPEALNVAKALRKDMDSKLSMLNPDFDPSAVDRMRVLGMGMGNIEKYGKEGVKVTSKDGKVVSKYAPDAKKNYTDESIINDVIPMENARFAKSSLSKAYKDASKSTGPIDQVKAVSGITGYQKRAERILNDAIDEATDGAKKALDPKFNQLLDVLKLQKQRFGSEDQARATLDAILSGGKRSKQLLEEVEQMDNLAGTKYSDLIKETLEAQEKTAKGIGQAGEFLKGTALAKEQAEAMMTPREQLIMRLREGFVDSKGIPDPRKTFKTLNEYATTNDPVLKANIDELAGKYGDDVAKEFQDTVDNVGLAAIFGDSSKTLIRSAGNEQAPNTLRGILQGLTWNTGFGAGAAQIGGAVGKAIGAQIPIRKALRKTLPAYFEKKAAFKNLSNEAKKELEKKIMNTVISRRDLIRELSKKMATKDEG